MDFRIQDAEILAVEIAADTGKQIGLVAHVDGDLQAFAYRRQAAFDNRHRAVDLVVQRTRLPSNVGCVMAQEIGDIQLLPHLFMGIAGQAVQPQRFQCVFLAVFQFAVRRRCLSTQDAQRNAVQVFQQFAFPCVPYLGAGAADVGDCQQVECREVALILDQPGKSLHHVRVGQVLLLRHVRHCQVMLYKEDDQFRIRLGNAVVVAEFLGVGHAQQ